MLLYVYQKPSGKIIFSLDPELHIKKMKLKQIGSTTIPIRLEG